jgi:DNA polymerase III subunit delta
MRSLNKIKKTPVSQMPAVMMVTGEEELLMERFLKGLIETIIPPGTQDFNLSLLEGRDFSVDSLIESLETLPVMAQRKMVIVRNAPFLESKGSGLTEKEEAKLLAYLKSPSSEATLVFYCQKKPDGRKKLVKTINSNAHTETFSRLKESELRQFIQEEIAADGKKMEPMALKQFAASFDYFGNNASQNLRDVSNEIIKLKAYAAESTVITLQQVQETTFAAFQNDVFQLIECFAHKRASETMIRFHKLLADGEPLLKIVGYLRNQFKTMLRVKELSSQGMTAAKMAAKLNQHPFAVQKTIEYSRHFETKDLVRVLNAFLTLDRQMKSGVMDARTSMELLISDSCR